jgi:hypothetical protein
MRARIDRHLKEIPRRGEADRRNSSFSRHLLTELGDIELHVARSRRTPAFVQRLKTIPSQLWKVISEYNPLCKDFFAAFITNFF